MIQGTQGKGTTPYDPGTSAKGVLDRANFGKLARLSDPKDPTQLFKKMAAEKEVQVQLEREHKIASQAITKNCGVSEKEGQALVNLAQKALIKNLGLNFALMCALDGDTDKLKQRLRHLDKAIGEYSQWLNSISSNKQLRTLIQNKVNSAELVEALKEKMQQGLTNALDQGSDMSGNGEAAALSELPGYFLLGVLADTCTKEERFRVKGLSELKGFHAALQQMAQLGGEALLQRYLDDFAGELIELDYTLRTMPRNHRYWLAGAVQSSGFVALANDELEGLRDAYLRVGAAKGLKLLEAVVPEGPGWRDSVVSAAKQIVELTEKKTNPSLAKELLSKAPSAERLEVLKACTTRPEAVNLFKRIKRHNVTAASFTEFLLVNSTESLELNGDTLTLLDVCLKLSSKPSQAPVAAFIVNRGENPFVGRDRDRLLKIAQTYPQAVLILSDYLSALKAGNALLAEAALQVGEAEPNPAQLSLLRKQLPGLSSDALQYATTSSSRDESVRRLMRPNGTHASAPVETKKVELEAGAPSQDIFSDLEEESPL